LNKQTFRQIYIATLAIILASCASVDHKVTTDQATQTDETPSEFGDLATDDPSRLIAEGKLTEAAMVYLSLANRKEAPEKQQVKLKAANLLLDAEHFEIAQNVLNETGTGELTEQQLTFFAYLSARIEIHNRNAELSLQWLDLVNSQDYLSFTNDAAILRLHVSAHNLNNDTLAATLERIKLDNLLTEEDPQAHLANQQAIIRGFLTYSSDQLKELSNNSSEIEKKWMNLSLLIKNSKNPFRLGNMLKSWKTLHPDHPVSELLLSILAPQDEDEPTTIENIALLLPLSGNYRPAAQAIRDGFLASYYEPSENSEIKPTVRIYDTGGDVTNILAIQQQAKDDGANVIIGPLRKEAVEMLAHGTNHNIPTLALNQIEDKDFYANNFYQFPLSPEEEAKQIARRSWQDGHNRAAIISPDSKWGKRVTEAFQTEWEILGGETVSTISYNAKKNDFSTPIKELLAIDESNARKKALSRLLGTPLTFEPRRRQDIDFIFMASFPRQAHLIPPQLSFFHATELPIYTTSHSFSGNIDQKKDRDLNRVIIGDMPWTIDTLQNNPVKQQTQQIWPNETKKLNRLYALGSDSYNILFYLNWLRSNSNSRIQGATGELSMSETNQIIRQLSWAKFKKGKPVLLPSTEHITSN